MSSRSTRLGEAIKQAGLARDESDGAVAAELEEIVVELRQVAQRVELEGGRR